MKQDIPRDHPRVRAAARQLCITMILRAWVGDGVLHVQNPYDVYRVPWRAEDPADTLPHAGRSEPGYGLSGGSAPPQPAASDSAAGPEPPTDHTEGATSAHRESRTPVDHAEDTTSAHRGSRTPVDHAEGATSARRGSRTPADTVPDAAHDDLTAIDGVGPVTAAKLHARGLRTYDDVRRWLRHVTEDGSPDAGIRGHTLAKIERWLEAHQC